MKMKNKKTEEREKRERDKKQRKERKQLRRESPLLERSEPKLRENPTILIVCEGENTEPSYFNQFKLSSATIKAVGKGYNTVSLVNQAIILSKEHKYDKVWCVFDKDDFSEKDFNEAILKAEKNKFGCAYSNQAFEYWLILHFEDHQGGGMNRNDYNDKINNLLLPFGATYDGKNCKIIDEDFFELLDGIDSNTGEKRVNLAIARAKRNYKHFDHSSPAKEESSTTVFKLVEKLLKYI